MKKIIHEHLLQLGVPAHLSGFDYATESILILLEDPESKYNLHGSILSAVADTHNSNIPAVERAIRHAIKVAFDRCDVEYNSSYFRNSVPLKICNPSVSEFLATIATRISDEIEEI